MLSWNRIVGVGLEVRPPVNPMWVALSSAEGETFAIARDPITKETGPQNSGGQYPIQYPLLLNVSAGERRKSDQPQYIGSRKGPTWTGATNPESYAMLFARTLALLRSTSHPRGRLPTVGSTWQLVRLSSQRSAAKVERSPVAERWSQLCFLIWLENGDSLVKLVFQINLK